MSVLPSGTVTFLFSDIEGSTRLTRELGDEWRSVLAEHRRLMRDAVEAENGREVDTQGDAFFFAFPRARDAVSAAVAAQRAHAAYEWPDGAEVRVRVGIHTGEPSVGEEGYLGLDVVRAARLCSAAHGGQVLASSTTRALLGRDVPEGIEVSDLGEHHLKDLDEPERVFQVAPRDVPADFPPLRTASSAPAPFAGRELQLAGQVGIVADDFARRVDEFVRQQIASGQQAAFDRLRQRGVVAPLPPARKRATTGELLLAAFVVAVLGAAVVAVLYLLLS